MNRLLKIDTGLFSVMKFEKTKRTKHALQWQPRYCWS